jgi:vesicle transport through interaction with t-SNAREs protein 1
MDNTPTSLFESYEHDFNQITASIRERLEGEAKDQRGGELEIRGNSSLC